MDAPFHSSAYENNALPIACGQTISQPYIVAYMTEMLEVETRLRVLEIGTGSGYQTALLSMLAESVFSIERIAELARHAHEVIKEIGLTNTTIMHGDGSLGWRPNSPYDAIVVAAASPGIPQPLIDQLAPGGRLVIPVGDQEAQVLTLVTRHKEDSGYDELPVHDVRFVPLLGQFGFAGGS